MSRASYAYKIIPACCLYISVLIFESCRLCYAVRRLCVRVVNPEKAHGIESKHINEKPSQRTAWKMRVPRSPVDAKRILPREAETISESKWQKNAALACSHNSYLIFFNAKLTPTFNLRYREYRTHTVRYFFRRTAGNHHTRSTHFVRLTRKPYEGRRKYRCTASISATPSTATMSVLLDVQFTGRTSWSGSFVMKQ